MICPNCSAETEDANFCPRCGTRLGGPCPACDTETLPGARYCTGCGEPVGRRSRGVKVGWLVAAAALIAVVLILFLPDDTERAVPTSATGGQLPVGTPAGGGAMSGGVGQPGADAPPILSGDMRTNADRLYNRIMTAAREGDRAEVARFMPMAIRAYGLVENLDDDGLYHLAVLHRTAGQPAEAEAVARRILEDSPSHLLALGVAAPAAAERGDSARAAELYRRLLAAYETEAARSLPEYLDHRPVLPEYRQDALDFTTNN